MPDSPFTRIPGRLGSVLAALMLAAALPAWGQSPGAIAELRDFRTVEVRAAGFTLEREMTVHVNAIGGGDKNGWEEWFDEDAAEPPLFAGGWIIDAESRKRVWEMTFDNTAGSPDRRRCDDDVKLPKGSYEVYFSAHGYERHTMFSHSSVNIDRRPESKGTRNMSGFNINSDNYDRMVERFMEKAEEYGLTVTVKPEDASSVSTFSAPLPVRNSVLESVRVGDGALLRKTITLAKDVALHITAAGEGVEKDDLVDHGWITRADTRERVWEMSPRKSRWAGGARKNRMFDGDVTLSKGVYELVYVTDDSHSNDDWNARPPYDPFRYGIAVSAKNEADRASIAVSDPAASAEHAILQLIKVGDNDLVSGGFTLANEAKLHVYGIGEWAGGSDAADYGWIVDAKTRARVWSMEDRATHHAGGASKNRLVDEIITLPKGSYIAYYQTDGSHSYGDWNSGAPYDEAAWGLTISGDGSRFDDKSVTLFSEEDEKDVVAQIVRARDGRHLSKSFTLSAPKKLRIYAVGEGMDREMYDYGWIEKSGSGEVVWEMTYGMTTRAGGAKKNRMVSTVVALEKGEYELHYETDGSHAFNDWNDDPPEDPAHWGISLYQE